MKNILKLTFVLLFVAGISTGCDNFLEPSVDQNKPTDEAIATVEDMRAVVNGILDDLNRTGVYGRDFYVSGDVMSDNAFSNGNSGRFTNQAQFNFTTTNGYSAGVWDIFYEAIAGANIVINDQNVESSPEADYIKGQAYALRAFSHMNLLLAFGQQFVSNGDPNNGIPYVTVYNDPDEFYPARDPIADVWTNIGNDLTQAVSLMDGAFDSSSPVYISTNAVQALLSRYHLYTENFDAAITAADAVINSGDYTLVSAQNLVNAWESGSGPNSIFELAFTSTDRLGTDNIARIYRATNYGDVEATVDLYSAYDADDARRDLFTPNGDTSRVRMTGKYVDELGSDNVRIIRYAEVLLNKAEALARRNDDPTDLTDALAIINNLSSTRGSSTVYASVTQEDVIMDVLAERRLELAMEGHRLYDLARHELDIPAVAVPAGSFTYSQTIQYGSYLYALPIPQGEMDANSRMKQNEGYIN